MGNELGTESRRGFAGTPAYAAPEVLEGGGGSKRADVYSFCATIYEALYGERVAEPLSHCELDSREVAFGPGHPRTLVAVDMLAKLLDWGSSAGRL